MRYIKVASEPAEPAVWRRIATEMLNLECGKRYYESGAWVKRSAKQPARHYPEIYDENDPNRNYAVRIKANVGFIYLPSVQSTADCQPIIRKLNEIIRKEIAEHEEIKTVLQSLHSIETGSQGFTALKSKINADKCNVNSHTVCDSLQPDTDKFSQRVFCYMSTIHGNPVMLERAIPYGKFTWVMLNLEELYSFLFREYVNDNVNMSLVSTIIYDNKNILNFSDNDLVFRSLGIENFNHFGNFSNMTAYGIFDRDSKMSTVRGRASVMSALGIDSNDGVEILSRSHKDNLVSSIIDAYSEACNEKKKMQNYPGYISALRPYDKYAIVYNRIYKSSWEILRWLSPWWKLIFEPGISSTHLVKEMRPEDISKLYQIENFSDVKVISVLEGETDLCQCCKCPLYDEVYCLFEKLDSNKCMIVCALCMHASLCWKNGTMPTGVTPDFMHSYLLLSNEYAQPAHLTDIFPSAVIGRVTYPRTFADVVDDLSFPGLNLDEYKRVLKTMYYGNCTTVKNMDRYIHNLHGIGRHDYETIAHIVKMSDEIYMFTPKNTRSHEKILQKQYFTDHLHDDEFDRVQIISVSCLEPRSSRSGAGYTFGGFVATWTS